MRTTLDLDDALMAIVRELAAAEGRPLGAIVSDLARRGLAPARCDVEGDLPVISPPRSSGVMTPELVRAALDEG